MFLNDDQWAELSQLYEDCVGSAMNMAVARMLKDFNERGHMTYDVLRAAIEETGFAPRPTAHYLRAILDRAEGDEIETLQDWEAAKKEYHYHIRRKWWTRKEAF